MTNAREAIEEIYDMGLNPELDYYAQLEPLAANGELANHNSSMKLLFRLSMIVDEQTRKINELEARLANPRVNQGADAARPIDATTPLSTEPNPNTNL